MGSVEWVQSIGWDGECSLRWRLFGGVKRAVPAEESWMGVE